MKKVLERTFSPPPTTTLQQKPCSERPHTWPWRLRRRWFAATVLLSQRLRVGFENEFKQQAQVLRNVHENVTALVLTCIPYPHPPEVSMAFYAPSLAIAPTSPLVCTGTVVGVCLWRLDRTGGLGRGGGCCEGKSPYPTQPQQGGETFFNF